MTDLEKRPDAPDFRCFVRDLMRVAVKMYNYVRTTEGQDPITFEDFSNPKPVGGGGSSPPCA